MRIVPRRRLVASAAVGLVFLLAGCESPARTGVQGYVEGEFVYVAAPLAGMLETLHVQRGDEVKAGAGLFVLDNTPHKAARDEAARRLAEARATADDLKKGKRPSELEALDAQLKQAVTALALAEQELVRLENLFRSRAAATQDMDRARSERDQDQQRVVQLAAELQTAKLGARPDQIAAAEANVRAREAALAKAEWELAQMRQSAPQAGVVFDTLFRPGEWISAGRPVVALLPPENIKVRAFVPQTEIGSVRVGQAVTVTADGVGAPSRGKVSFISPKAEFTPPVIYSRESRAKLVFMIEATFDRETAARLHPGQPVDVRFE